MNCLARFPSSRRVAWIATLALGWFLFPCGPLGEATAQIFTPADSSTAIGHRIYDYYNRYTDPGTARTLATVEQYHLSGRTDLPFVFAYFPNHPKALHVIAYDTRYQAIHNVDPSIVIQRFEFAIRSFPRRAYTYAQYGRYLISIGRRRTGIALLDEAIRLDPKLLVAQAWREEDAQRRSKTESTGGGAGKGGPPTNSENTPRRTR